MTILAKPAILHALRTGDILIAPFNGAHVKNASVDVTLGADYWLESPPQGDDEATHDDEPIVIPSASGSIVVRYDHVLNPYDPRSVSRMWLGPYRALPLPKALPGLPKGTKIIPLHPGQNILGCTEQFIGSMAPHIDTQMQARSSIGRNQVTVCRCAGKGDIGFANRWTMEISNHGNRTVLLAVGRRIAQIVFKESTGIHDPRDAYYVDGKYQKSSLRGLTLEQLEAQWDPEDMLPKCFLDPEAVNG